MRLAAYLFFSESVGDKVPHHFEVALESHPPSNPILNLYPACTGVFLRGLRFDDANARIERAESHAIEITGKPGRAMKRRP